MNAFILIFSASGIRNYELRMGESANLRMYEWANPLIYEWTNGRNR
ncbi:MAG: hypothetical protein IPP46_07310 [Bacteroidetes bacterium]|nr:hypothetical protein [Bacteroidota bacterium]